MNQPARESPAGGVALPLAALVLVAFAWRLVLVARTPVPSEDGVNYLWMAEQFARGDFTTPLSEVFPPLLALLMAPLAHLPWGGQVVLALLGALAVVPIARLSAIVVGPEQRRAYLVAALLAALSGLPARYCAEVYTEPVFALAIASAAVAGMRGRFWQCGVWAGAAFWLRSEALLLPLAFCVFAPRHAWRSMVVVGVAVALLGLWRHVAGLPFDALPKLDFNWEKANVGGDDTAWSMLGDLAQLPGAWFEAFGVAGALALLGFVTARGQRGARPLLLTLLLALIVIVAFTVRRRFLVAWWPLIVPFAVLGLWRLRPRWRNALLAAAVALSLFVGLRTTDPNRLAEREVAGYVRAQLRPGERFVTDLTRVLYFAGQRPLPPRHLTADELIAAARAPSVRFLVLGSRRATTPAVVASLPEFTLLPVPASITARGIDVYARRP